VYICSIIVSIIVTHVSRKGCNGGGSEEALCGVIEYIGVVSVHMQYMVYNCVDYCDTYLEYIGVVSVHMQYMVYNCVDYCDTYLCVGSEEALCHMHISANRVVCENIWYILMISSYAGMDVCEGFFKDSVHNRRR
jgi:hypothetical protein